MNKSLLLPLMALVAATSATAQITIWQNNYESPNTFFTPGDPVEMHSGREDAWLGFGTASIFDTGTSNVLQLASGGSSQTRGLVRAFDADNHPEVIDTTGDAGKYYQFTFDLINVPNFANLNLQFLHGTRDDDTNTPTNTYSLDIAGPTGADLTHTTIGTGTLTNIIDLTFGTADIGTGITITFDWDGTGDLVMVWDTQDKDGVGSGPINNRMDNMVLSVVPEPSTYAILAGFAAMALVAYRRRK